VRGVKALSENNMNKRVKTLTTRFARDTETQSCHERKYKCGVYFVHAGTRDQNKRHGFLKEYVEGPLRRFDKLTAGKAQGREESMQSLLFLWVWLQGTVAGFLILVLRNYKSRNISSPLCVSVPLAKRVVNLYTLHRLLFDGS
jgi:hypothetical protein